MWQNVNTIIPRANTSIRVGETVTNDGDVIANQFNDFFSSNMGKKLADVITTNQACGVAVPGTNQFHFSGVTVDEVSELLSKFDGKKATGLDNISPIKLLKIGHVHLAKPLAYIMNLSLSTGIVPSARKISRVSPILKEGDPPDTSNYKPISVIPTCMKIFEKVVHTPQLYDFMQRYQILSPNQSGFRPMHSTQTVLVEVCDYLLDNMNEGFLTGAVFLDLKSLRHRPL